MALVLEDGTGVTGANTYNLVADADAFWADRNVADWAGAGASDLVKAGLLVQAGDYLNQFFRPRGEVLSYDQGMGFPTLTYDGVPQAVRHAQLILAREARLGPLSTVMGEPVVTMERKQLQGVGEKEVHYATNKVDPYGRAGSTVAAMLLPYTMSPGWMQQARIDRA